MKKRADEYSYTTSVLANEINITPEGLRYYEKRGIGRSARKAENGYRRYQPQEVVVLRLVRNLTAYGFSLKEAIDLCTKEPYSQKDFLAALQEKRTLLEKHIREEQIALRRMDEGIGAVERFVAGDGKVWFEKRPAFCHLAYNTGLYARKYEELNLLMQKWMDLMPIAYPMPVLTLEEYRRNEDPFVAGGFSIEEENLPDPSYFDQRWCKRYPERTYLCAASRQTDLRGVSLLEQDLQAALCTMREMNLEVEGDIFFQSVAASESGQEITIFYKVYLPTAPA